MAQTNNYTLGRGKLYFGQFPAGTYTAAAQPERYLGNTPEFSVTMAETKLDHFNSDEGVKEKDASISLQVDRTGQLTTDNVNPKNIALFFFGSEETIAEAGGALADEFADIQPGYYYQLGVSVTRPTGARGLLGATDDSNSTAVAPVVFDATDSNSSATPYTEGTDYTVDLATGRLFIVEAADGGTIAEGSTVGVTFNVDASTYSQVISGSTAVAGQLRFVAHNPEGLQVDYYFPYAKISPNGDYQLKGDDWQKIPFNVEILAPTDREAIYANGRAFAT